MPQELNNTWEERFYEMFCDENNYVVTNELSTSKLKDFIKTVEKEAYERGKEVGFKKENQLWLESLPKIEADARKEERKALKKKVEELVFSTPSGVDANSFIQGGRYTVNCVLSLLSEE